MLNNQSRQQQVQRSACSLKLVAFLRQATAHLSSIISRVLSRGLSIIWSKLDSVSHHLALINWTVRCVRAVSLRGR